MMGMLGGGHVFHGPKKLFESIGGVKACRERTLMISFVMNDPIRIRGARQHNLKGIDLDIPRRQLTVITGPSGSGKSSLALDTLFAEGQRRYVESLSTYAKQFLDRMEKPDVDSVEGISPAVAIEQKNPTKSSRSTVGTATEVYDYSNPDEFRVHPHDNDIPYDWTRKDG